MKNVLNKRYLREFKSDFYKYAVIFFIMIFMIGEGAGYFVASESMIRGFNESFEKNKIEDGNFKLLSPLNVEEVRKVEDFGVRLYENFSKEIKVDTHPSGKAKGEKPENRLKLRMFRERKEVNLAYLMEGRLPLVKGEIAIDRTVSENKGLKIGDRLTGKEESETFVITGLITLPDYTSMFESNQDMIFDVSSFSVAIVSEEDFSRFEAEALNYTYSYHYNEKPLTKKEEKKMADDLIKDLSSFLEIEEFVPAYLNQGIQFSGEDFVSDGVMIRIFLYTVLAIIAFIFAITINNTISKEAEVIGTLLSLGYKKREIAVHYMALPLIVTLISAVIGNILGYLLFKDLNLSLYYESYSLPRYEVRWNLSAFLETTGAALLIMLVITFVSIQRRLRLSPLKFLTHDLRRGRKKRGIKLPTGLPFFTRFRLRVIFQNMSNYIMLLIGVLFAYFLLMFSLVFPVMMERFEENLKATMFANYQYILKVSPKMLKDPVTLGKMFTKNEEAEKFVLKVLETDGSVGRIEDILVYGVENDSRFVKGDLSKKGVVISYLMAEKYKLSAGDTFSLNEKYTDKTFQLHITEVNDYEGSLALFMNRDSMKEIFDIEKDFFSGYFSNTMLTDLDKRIVGTVIDEGVLTKLTRQMKMSMGKLMNVITVFSVLIFGMLIFLLTKTIIEKNSKNISMAKIMGYRNQEIRKLYVGATSLMMTFFLMIGLPMIEWVMSRLFIFIFRTRLKGWIAMEITWKEELTMFLLGLFTYIIVSFFEYRRIKKVPMDEVLKATE